MRLGRPARPRGRAGGDPRRGLHLEAVQADEAANVALHPLFLLAPRFTITQSLVRAAEWTALSTARRDDPGRAWRAERDARQRPGCTACGTRPRRWSHRRGRRRRVGGRRWAGDGSRRRRGGDRSRARQAGDGSTPLYLRSALRGGSPTGGFPGGHGRCSRAGWEYGRRGEAGQWGSKLGDRSGSGRPGDVCASRFDRAPPGRRRVVFRLAEAEEHQERPGARQCNQ